MEVREVLWEEVVVHSGRVHQKSLLLNTLWYKGVTKGLKNRHDGEEEAETRWCWVEEWLGRQRVEPSQADDSFRSLAQKGGEKWRKREKDAVSNEND